MLLVADMTTPSLEQLHEAIGIREEINTLEQRLQRIFTGTSASSEEFIPSRAPATRRSSSLKADRRQTRGGKRKRKAMSPETRARLSAAAKRRWKISRRSGRSTL